MLQSIAPARRCEALNGVFERLPERPRTCAYVADLYAASDAELCVGMLTPRPTRWRPTRNTLREEPRALGSGRPPRHPACLQDEMIRVAIIGEDGQLHGAQQCHPGPPGGQGISALGDHGHRARQVAHVPGARRPLRPDRGYGEPVRVPAARPHRRPGLPSKRGRWRPFGVSVSVLTGECNARRAPGQVYRTPGRWLRATSCSPRRSTCSWHGDELGRKRAHRLCGHRRGAPYRDWRGRGSGRLTPPSARRWRSWPAASKRGTRGARLRCWRSRPRPPTPVVRCHPCRELPVEDLRVRPRRTRAEPDR